MKNGRKTYLENITSSHIQIYQFLGRATHANAVSTSAFQGINQSLGAELRFSSFKAAVHR
jgi:hypothetical protein